MEKVFFVLLLVCSLANSQFAHAQQLAEITYSCSLADAKTLHGDGSDGEFLKEVLDERNYFENLSKKKFLYRDFISDGLDKVSFGGKSYSKANPLDGFLFIEDADYGRSVLSVGISFTEKRARVMEVKIDQYGSIMDSFADVELWLCKEVESRIATPKEIKLQLQRLQARQKN